VNASSRPSRAYWICQASGWLLYVVVAMFQSLGSLPFQRSVLEPFLAAAIGMSLTHGARSVARRRAWVLLEPRAIWSRVVLTSVLLASVHVGLLLVIELYSYGDRPPSAELVALYAVMRWSMIFFIWLSVYFGHALMGQRHEAEVRRLSAERALEAAELSALRSQLNPHFLFNSLNSIRALIASDQEAAQACVTRIANILRYSLSAGQRQTVAFEQELEIVDDYLALEAYRLEERLIVERHIDDGVGAIRVPFMLLQLLVENAIKHGISHLPAGGALSISARKDADALVVEVKNPTPTPGSASGFEPRDGVGIGLSNAADRLALLYGGRAALKLDLSVVGQATSTVRIPISLLVEEGRR